MLFGLETEYLVAIRAGFPIGGERLRAALAGGLALHPQVNSYLPNGGRLYLDVGVHPEWATAECTTLDALVAQDAAGDRLVTASVAHAEAALQGELGAVRLSVYRRNIDSDGQQNGCHENYLVRRSLDAPALYQGLLGHLASRILLVGTGAQLRQRYHLSGRALAVHDTVSAATTRDRPFVSSRDEPLASMRDWRRVHVIAGDVNLSQRGTALKVGATACVLAVLQERLDAFAHLELADPVAALHTYNLSLDGRAAAARVTGPAISAWALQAELLAEVQAHHAKAGLPDTLVGVLATWEETLEALEAGWETAVGMVEWASKRAVLEAAETRNQWSTTRAREMGLQATDIALHQIWPHPLARHLAGTPVVTEAEIENALEVPPATRAQARGAIVSAALAAAQEAKVSWERAALPGGSRFAEVCALELGDPYNPRPAGLEGYLASVAKRAHTGWGTGGA